jgi:hypothetical protein
VLPNPWVKVKTANTKIRASNKNQNINLSSAKTSTLHQPKSKQTYLDYFYFFITITIDHRIFSFPHVPKPNTNKLPTHTTRSSLWKQVDISWEKIFHDTTGITVPKSVLQVPTAR